MNSSANQRVSVSVAPEFLELAKIVHLTPAEILEQFIQDLLGLPQSGGSDEQQKAGDYFRRTSMAGFERREPATDFIKVDRK